MSQIILSGFPPVIDEATHTLILGSFPGQASLDAQQYYAFRHNKFWELLGAVIHVDLRSLPYEARLRTLLAHGIGLWDVIANANRTGSLDSQIKNHLDNDIAGMIESLPHLKTIAFNGGTAAKHGLKQLGTIASRYQIILLPSSSPAYTLAFEQKLQSWKKLCQFVCLH
ncbi:DNA-deoxyinosine glycosylase [Undibacterium sp. 14-3-2]|uniref:DNA-deoxyinosine glycosylase n=1 Tax=Undibacterium sp. 14-3-2 TaxID=2800129 RepID=UPI0019062DD5|nr:DNA-deoxyinosine glycosylase [Undibacterium sp. 14-3-2]MBK1891860.1 DNA-deoxyinosine glycosylase [Undibacterium sp. 14-3-2]